MSKIKQIFELFMRNKQSTKTVADFGKWLVSSQNASEKDDLLQQHWWAVEHSKSAESIEKSYKETCFKIKNLNGVSTTQKPASWKRMAKIAAIFIALIISVLVTYYGTVNYVHTQNWKEIYASYGQTRTILLPDSSLFTINSGSKLIYPDKFRGKNRQVFLSGEAYATITKDSEHPFIVSAGDVEIRVLGTAFNIKSYSEDSEIEVALVEGSILLKNKMTNDSENLNLEPGEMVKVDKKSGIVQRYKFPTDTYVPRVKGGGLMFINERLRDIAAQIERIFNVKIIIKDAELAEKQYYSAFVNNETLDQILSTLNANNTMDIIQEDDIIYITNKMQK